MPKITEKMWREHLAAIAAGKMDTRKASKSLGCSMRRVQQRCEAAGIKVEAPPPPPEPSPAPSPASPEFAPKKTEGNGDYERAISAAGGTPTPPAAGGPIVPSPGDVAAAGEKMGQFCVDTLNTIKGAYVVGLAQFRYRVDPGEPRIKAVTKLGLPAETAVRTNADKLYPYLHRLMSGWGPVVAWLAMDALAAQSVIKSVAVEQGWKPPEKKQEPAAERKEPARPATPAPGATPSSSSPPPPDVKPVAVVVPGAPS